MASELLKNKTLIQKLKEPDVASIDFGLQSTGFEELFTLPEPKPEKLLNIQEENRKGRLLDSLNIIGGGLEDTSLDFIKRENFEKGSNYFTNRVTDPTRLKFLNEAAKKFGYKDWNSVPKTKPIPGKRAYGDRERIAQEATRRQEGVVEGKGKVKPTEAQKANIKKSHWANKSEAEVDKILGSPKQRAYWAKKTQNQADLLEAVKSGKYKTSEEIRKAVGFEKEVFNKEVKNLFKNVYSQIGDLNKPKKMQTRFGVSFLPRDLDEMYKLRSKLGQIEGFESVEQRNIYQQIDEAYGQKGTNPNRKAFAEATKKASDFSNIKNAIKAKYPNIKLELDHPLDYKTIKGLGKEGEKFLFVTPVEKSINRGFKATLGDAYAKAVKAKDKANILKIENLAQDIGVTIGQVRGTKVMDYGTGPLRTTNLGDEIIANLRQQNVIVDNIKKLQKSGELKARLTDIGMPRAGESGYSTKKVSEAQIKSIKKIIASIACPGKAMGGRIGFQDGTSCFEKGKKMINTGKIPEGAPRRNFVKFANQAVAIGKQAGTGLRAIAKFGIIPEMIFLGADTFVRTTMGDTLDEAFTRASDFYRSGDQALEADLKEIERKDGPYNAAAVVNMRKMYAEKQKLSSLEQAEQADLALAGTEFDEMNIGMTEGEIKELYADRKQKQQNDLFNASISEAEEFEGLAGQAEFEDIKGISKKQSSAGQALNLMTRNIPEPVKEFFRGRTTVQEPDVSGQTLENYLSDKIPKEEQNELRKIIDSGSAAGVLDAMKKIEAAQEVPEGAIREPNVFDEERKILFELAKTNPALAERYFGPRMMPFGEMIDSTDLQDDMNLDRGIYALGGRIGFAEGPKNPGRRTFMKLLAGIASLPVLGKFLKPAAPVVQKLVNTTTVMPDWFPKFVDNFLAKGVGKKIDADLMEYKVDELPGVTLTKGDDGKILVEGKNAYDEPYEIAYEPPGYEVIDETTGKAVKTPGEFQASDTRFRQTGPELDDVDVDYDTVKDIDDIVGGNSTQLEGFAKGTGKTKYTKGQRLVDEAEARSEYSQQERADFDAGPEIDPTDYYYED